MSLLDDLKQKYYEMLNPVKQGLSNAINDNSGFFQQGKFTFQPIHSAVQSWQSKPSNVLGSKLVQSTGALGQSLVGLTQGMGGSFLPKPIKQVVYQNIPEPKNTGENIANFVGNTAGMIYGPVGKALGALNSVGESAATKLIPKVAPKIIQKVAPAIGGETLQTLGLLGGQKISGDNVGLKDIPLQLATGLGLRGIGGVVGSTVNFKLPKQTMDEVVKAEDMIKNPDNYIDFSQFRTKKLALQVGRQQVIDQAAQIIDQISAKHLPTEYLDKTAGDTKAQIKALIDLHNQNKLTNVSYLTKSKPDEITNPKINLPGELSKSGSVLPWEEPGYVALEKPTLPVQTELNKIPKPAIEPVSAKVASTNNIPPTEVAKIQKLVPDKVNLLDYFRTPDRVLQKIGLGKEAETLKTSYNNYLDQLPKEINKITDWYNQVKSDPTASQRIFKYLDGQPVSLNPNETKVAGEIQTYLKDWADKLDLPNDQRVTNYITHIFDKDFIKKDFDEDLAKIIAEKVPGSVYDPFTQQRLGKLGYVEDAFKALDAYVKRAVRKVNMDPALEAISRKSNSLPLESWKYVKSYTDRVNLRPTDIDTMIDNLVKQSPIGYKMGPRPLTAASKSLRQSVYRGTLGLNVGSAVRNLTQGVNTYAKLGERWTAKGYFDSLKSILTNGDELNQVGVLRDTNIQDRQLSAVKGLLQKADEGLFSLFNLAEKVNRGVAYFGAKSKALSQGLSEQQAIQEGIKMARDTQFTFGSVDTPLVMSSDLAKTLGQFQSFNLKQTEFLGEMVKNKEFLGMARWLGANLVIMATVGKMIGFDFKDIVPFSGVITGDTKLGETPPVKLAQDTYSAVINAPNKYGQTSDKNILSRLGDVAYKDLPAFVPAGVQIKKTIEGIKAVNEGGSFSQSGRLQYPIDQTTGNYIRAGLFGKSNLDEAKNYFDNGGSVLSEKQTSIFKAATDKINTYNQIIAERENNAKVNAAKDEVRQSGQATKVGDIYLYLTKQFDSKTGQMKDVVRSVDMGKQIPKIELTGQPELDKKLTSAYNSAITSKISDITKLYKLGQVSASEAETQIKALQSQKLPTAKKISIKKTKVKKITLPKIKKISLQSKVKKPKKLKVYKLKAAKFKKVKLKRIA